jgi:ribosomal protein S18 acetylase RimI-like enzyme
VAEEHGRPVGFLVAEAIDGELHVWELAVQQQSQGRGLGRRLMAEAIEVAARRGLDAVTLTTFLDVPWNQPFYARLGFVTLEPNVASARLQGILRAEAARGLPRRCAMRLALPTHA